MSLIGSALVGIAALVLALVLVSAIGSALIQRRYPPRGRITMLGGAAVHHLVAFPDDHDGSPPVVVIHGASATLEEARLGLGPALARRRVIYLDRPGHGHSSRGGSAMAAPAEQARVVAALLDSLGVERAVVVGHSWGAAVAAALGVLYPDKVAGLVFVAPATHPWPDDVTWYNRLAGVPLVGLLFVWTVPLPVGLVVMRMASRIVFAPDPVPPDYADRGAIPLVLRPWSFRANCGDLAHLKANLLALSPRYRQIAAPTVIVTGDSDGVVAPYIHAEGLARDIAGAELVMIEGAGHMPHHAHAAVVVDAIERVTERARAGARGQIPV